MTSTSSSTSRGFTKLIDHDRRNRGQGGAQIQALEFLMRGCHKHPITRRLDRDIDGRALNYDNKEPHENHSTLVA